MREALAFQMPLLKNYKKITIGNKEIYGIIKKNLVLLSIIIEKVASNFEATLSFCLKN